MPTDDTIAVQREQVLAWLAQGKKNTEIAELLGLPVRIVASRIREVVAEVRENARSHVQQRFTQHDERLEYLYKACLKRIERMYARENGRLDHQAVRAAVCVLERQARLLGLDRATGTGGASFNSWLDGQSGAELEKLAATYGLELPKPFDTGNTDTPDSTEGALDDR